ncbi:unnamed protein product [Schistocephalus solidus]|uniref:Uncharacterized protein n=1 Tax=Schistocephalus solidus TaxID=70667 RepID=A0A183STB4_SCHSO|nr:unnamed protein product [Schistocephalus solidus]
MDVNRPSTIFDAPIGRLPQVEINSDLDLLPCLLRISETGSSFISTSGRGSGNSVITTEAFRSSTSPGRSMPESFYIIRTATLSRACLGKPI